MGLYNTALLCYRLPALRGVGGGGVWGGGGGGALFIAFLSVGTGYWSEPLRGSLSCCECKV